MKIRDINKYIIFFIIVIFSFIDAFALEIEVLPTITKEIQVETKNQKEITRKDFFKYLSSNYKKDIPSTYKYINLNFKDLWNDDKLKEYLQILVYKDIIENKKINIYADKTLNAYTFYNFYDKKLNIYAIPSDETINDLKNRNTKLYDVTNINIAITNQNEKTVNIESDTNEVTEKKKIFTDVYNTLLDTHYSKDNLTEDKLINSAIEGLTKWTEDKYTTYFPPSENKDFEEDLNWKYEWIWAYVDMETPWEFKIVSPISWTPAEKSWLKWWDKVISVNWKEITKENSLNEVVSWIKWPAWTKVLLKIKRWNENLDIEIVRAKIIINEVDSRSINNETYYIQIRTFWNTVKDEFENALKEMKKYPNTKTLIMDLRNNPWGYLDQVTDMLWFFISEWEPTAVIKYRDYKISSKSRWYDLVDFSKFKIILLENSWTASASEIMIWSIKDYYPKAIIVWEKSYWKGSVQTIKPYNDWSALKYTIAKWFTWKTETWIDQIWIIPDIEIKLDEESFKNWIDNQLQKAIELSN